MGKRYVVLGCGRQGTAAAYDIARYGAPETLLLTDVNRNQVHAASQRIREFFPEAPVNTHALDASDSGKLRGFLEEERVDIVVSGLPYACNLAVAQIAIPAGISMVDMGGNTGITLRQLELDSKARDAAAVLVPDCGMGPGMNLSLLAYAMAQMDDPQHAYVYEAGLPLNPEPPWNYALTFNIAGLTNEYTGEATFLREGELVSVDALTGAEEVEIPELGMLETRVTTGGLSTTPWTFQGTLQTLENKTLRYPGHWGQIEAFRDLGLLEESPIEVDGHEVIPRHVFHTLFEPKVAAGSVRDIAVILVRVVGNRDGAPAEAIISLVDRYDEETQFTAMERVTGWHVSIMAQLIAAGEIGAGAHSVESAVSPNRVVEEARRRGFDIRVTYTSPATES
ncbi:MAG: saccharopine dehydrogenase family protein [Thermoplasmata archaeon]